MRNLFYTIAGRITESLTGCNGTVKGLENFGEVLEYIRVFDDVTTIINIICAVAVTGCVIGFAVICKRIYDKLSKKVIA